MAPEQIRCEPVELRTDLYGLGVILFQALTGRLPFDGRTEVDVLMAHCSLPPPALSEVCPGVFFPESLAQLVRALLHKHPSGRPTVEEFLERLASVEEEVFGTISLAGPTLQGIASRPLLPSVTPPLGDWERHTGVTQREWKASVPTLGSGAPVSSVPPHSYPVPGRKKGAIAISVGVVALLALFAFTAFQLGRSRGGDAARAAAPIVATAPLAQPVPAAAQPAAASSFTLTIDSIPSGASVSEGGIALGETPVTITLERSSLAAGPRKFVLRQDGFAAYTLEQFDSQAAVNARIVLVPAGGKTLRPRAARSLPASGGIGSLTPLEAPSPKRNENVLLDIRTRR
jgi:serine/threonine-protein kinase